MKTLNYALIGAGFVGALHARAVSGLEAVRLCAVADVNQSAAEELAKPYGAKAYADAEEMLRREKPDAVSICLPTFLHRDAVKMAAAHGCAILCEKPLALTESDCEQMIAVAERYQVPVSVAQVVRWWPEYREVARMKAEDELGAIHSLHAVRILHGTRGGWFADPKLGGGALFDLMAHDADYLLWMMGDDISEINAVGDANDQGAWKHVFTQVRYRDGRYATLEAGNDMPEGHPFTSSLRVVGSKAVAAVSSLAAKNIAVGVKAASGLSLYQNGVCKQIPCGEGSSQDLAFAAELQAFVDCIKTGKTVPVPLSEGLRTIRFLNAVRQKLEQSGL